MISLQPNLTLRQLFDQYYKPKRLLGRSPRSVEGYNELFASLKRYSKSEWLIASVDDEQVEGYLAWLLQVNNRSPATANKYLAMLRALVTFSRRRRIRESIGEHNVPRYELEVDKLKVPKRSPESWRMEQIERLLQAANEETGTICGTPASVWWLAFLLFCYYTGYRINAILRIRRCDFDPDEGAVLARAEIQKHGADDRRRLPSQLVQLLSRLTPADDGLLFPYPYSELRTGRGDHDIARSKAKTIRRHFTRLMKRAGLTTRRWKFHKLRATHATELKNQNGDPTASLGHSDSKVTRRYLDPTNSTAPSAAELLPAPKLPDSPIRLMG